MNNFVFSKIENKITSQGPVDPLVAVIVAEKSRERVQIKRTTTAIDSLASNPFKPTPAPCFPCCLWCPNLLAIFF